LQNDFPVDEAMDIVSLLEQDVLNVQ